MALIMLFVMGVLAGWFGSIVARTEERGAILRQIAIALAASLVVGLVANSGTFLGSLSWTAMGAALGASALALVGYHLYLKRGAEA